MVILYEVLTVGGTGIFVSVLGTTSFLCAVLPWPWFLPRTKFEAVDLGTFPKITTT